MRCLVLSALALSLALSACGDAADENGAPVARGSDSFPEQPTPTPAGRFAPRNECIELPGAKQFFVSFEKAVRERDADALLALTDKGVKLDFGGGGGLTTFRERLGDKQGELWNELDQIITLGCARGANGDMVLPWYFAQDLGVDDPFAAMLVTGPDVPLREAASAEAPVVETISWDTVTLANGYDAEAKFLGVTSRSGKQGFVAADKLRSLAAYRLAVAKTPKDEWRIVSFVAGD